MTSTQYSSTCFCHTCDQEFRPLGIARHRAMHRDKEQSCEISYADGSTYKHDYSSRRQPQKEKKNA